MEAGDLSIYTQHEQRLHGSQPCTADHINLGSALHFGPFGFFSPLLMVLHLKGQPWHPTSCALSRAVGVSTAAFEPQSCCNPHRQVREGQEGTEVSDLGSYFPWACDITEKDYTFLVKCGDLAIPGPSLDSFSHAT